MSLTVTVKGFADLKVKMAHQLHDGDLMALNAKEKPEGIKPAALKDLDTRGANLRAMLEPASWNVIRLASTEVE